MGSGRVMGNRKGHSEELGHVLTPRVMLTSLTLESASSAVSSGTKALFPKLPLAQDSCFYGAPVRGAQIGTAKVSAIHPFLGCWCHSHSGVTVTVLDFKVLKRGKVR